MNRFFVISLVLVAHVVFGQDYSGEMKKIMAWFSPKNIQVSATYQAYANREDAKPLETMESMLLKQDTLQYFKMGFVEMVRGKSFGLNINGRDKTILLQNTSPKVTSIDLASQMDFSLLLKHCSKVELNKISDQQSALYLYFPQGQYQQLTVYFDPTSHKPLKVETIYTVSGKGVFASTAASKLIVTYKSIIANPTISKSVFVRSSYVSKNAGVWTPQAKYQHFTVTEVNNAQ